MNRVIPIGGKNLPTSVRRALRSPTYAIGYVKRSYTINPMPAKREDKAMTIPDSKSILNEDFVFKRSATPSDSASTSGQIKTTVPTRIKAKNIIAALIYVIAASFLIFTGVSRICNAYDIGITHVTRAFEPDRFSENGVFSLYVDTAYIKLTCKAKGIDRMVAAPVNTARMFVKSLGLGIDDDDILSCSDDTVITSGMDITVDILEKKTSTRTATVPFPVQTTYIQTIPYGSVNVLHPGTDGSAVQTVENTYINGELTETTVLEQTITKEPITQIQEEGSGGTVIFGGREYRFSYYRDVEATAYGGPMFEDGHTSTGKIVDIGMIAVDPNVIPLGSQVLIIGDNEYSSYDGIYSAEDTGGYIIGDRIDVYTGSDIDVATMFGRRAMRVYILE